MDVFKLLKSCLKTFTACMGSLADSPLNPPSANGYVLIIEFSMALTEPVYGSVKPLLKPEIIVLAFTILTLLLLDRIMFLSRPLNSEGADNISRLPDSRINNLSGFLSYPCTHPTLLGEDIFSYYYIPYMQEQGLSFQIFHPG